MQKRIKSMPINIERPRSALLRGVRITEFKGHIINPDPILLQETDFLLEEFLSPTKLKALTGVNDLNSVKHLEMIVDTSETSLGNFGIYLPSLKQLKLNGSYVPRVRDLGTSLTHLKILWLSRSGLVELDGLPTLTNLEELYLAYNEIADISPCSMLDNLKCLDLEGNLIDDLKQVEFLNLCSKLENLTLYGNPICAKPTPDASDEDSIYSYRHEVIKILPHLKTLDDELTLSTKSLSPLRPINSNPLLNNNNNRATQSKHTVNYECPFDDDWQLINQFIAEGIGPSEDKLAINESLRPGTSSSRGSRPSTSVRPLSSMRPLSSYKIRTPAVNQERPSSRLTSSASNTSAKSSRLNTAETQESPEQISDILIDSSALTVGPTLQGNPLKALMARKRPNSSNFLNETSQSDAKPIESDTSAKVSLNEAIQKLEINESSLLNKELKHELLNWKKDHARKLEERKHYFEPQVLKIEDNYEEPEIRTLSDNDETNNYNFYDEYHDIKNNTNIPNEDDYSNEITNLLSPRQQSASRRVNELVLASDEAVLPKEKRSKSKHRSQSRSNKNRHKTPLDDELAVHREDSDLSSRIETGDTGYASFSSLSVSSLSSLTDKLAHHNSSSHQPIIVSSHLVKAPALLQPLQHHHHHHQQQLTASLAKGPSTNTLKQLKTNLMPLSASYLQKK